MANTYNPLEGERADLTFKLQGEGTEEKISIIIVHRDRPEYLNICLQTITVASFANNIEIIVVDNSSGELSQSFLDQIEEDGVKVIRNEENLWWTKAANQGARAANKNSKYLVFMHHDVNVVNPAWLDLMVNVSDSVKSGMVGLRLKYYDMNGQRMPFIDPSCMLLTRECWKDCGPFAEELPQEGAPFILFFKANKLGYKPQIIDQKQNPCVFHYHIFAMDYSEFERFAERARVVIPQLMMSFQENL